ncbi:hypothetical protein ElyMa_002213600 [Elysia marginata]|uniref:Uncharacterized protein n=1 Tax=Elysia marginata TaxID=1093978 RepID=A0AAV4FVY9_9GAST|nr:hypothetical protein ElyMa_002213600 [Elysia marginata]
MVLTYIPEGSRESWETPISFAFRLANCAPFCVTQWEKYYAPKMKKKALIALFDTKFPTNNENHVKDIGLEPLSVTASKIDPKSHGQGE